jgi:exopolyphosphatase/guanosine-5'-triphosphate,3'-diphosphate pyrophosphatase
MLDLRASIDIGSNSILLLIGDFSESNYKEIRNESSVTALGRDLDKTGVFHEESMSCSFDVLKDYAAIAKSCGIKPENIITTATEASRVAKNAPEFFERVQSETGINIQIITSEAEAYYSTKGIMFNTTFEEDEICVMDIGGASTELIKLSTKKNKILKDFSMPVGAVRVTNWIEENCFQENLDKVLKDYNKNFQEVKSKKLFCVAGTMTSLAGIFLGLSYFDEKKIHGLNMNTSDIHSMVNSYNSFSKLDFLKEFPFLGKRSATIFGGLLVATAIFKELGVELVEISTYGLRYGTIEQGRILDEHLVK